MDDREVWAILDQVAETLIQNLFAPTGVIMASDRKSDQQIT